ncbi:MAG: amidohydrolase family protein, partial [Pirellulaceae bacterium]
GTIDIISSGHKARSLEKKIQEIDKAPFGMISLETTLAEVITHLIAPGILTWTQAIEKLSCNPARLLGLPTGTLRVGAPADLILIDPEERWTVDPELLVSRGTNTPLAGNQLQGRVRQCMVDGQVVLFEPEPAVNSWRSNARILFSVRILLPFAEFHALRAAFFFF